MRIGDLNIPTFDTPEDIEALIAEILASQSEKKEEKKEEPAAVDTSTSTTVPFYIDNPLGNPNTTEGQEGYAPMVELSPELLARFKEILRVGVTYEGDIDDTVNYYNNAYNEIFDFLGQTGAQGTNAQTYIQAVGAPEYLANLRKGVSPTEEQMLNAYGSIYDVNDTDELAAILSEYYGYEITPVENVDLNANKFGANTYKKHTGSSADDMQQFLALTRPILEDQIPYIMATQNVDYAKAIELAYLQDPMLQSLHFKYDVDPYRQTDDGSTYLFDPFSAGEIRTLEVEDKILEPAFKALFLATAGYFTAGALTGPMTSILGGNAAAGAAAAKAITSGSIAALQGKDLEGILTAAVTAGALDVVANAMPIPGMKGATINDILEKYIPTENITLGGDAVGAAAGIGDGFLNPEQLISGVATVLTDPNAVNILKDAIDPAVITDVCFFAAQALQTEDGVSPDQPLSEEYIRQAIEIYNEMKEEGFSHLQIMAELNYEPSAEYRKVAQAQDLLKLQALREGAETTGGIRYQEYMKTLGRVDEETGKKHENEVYQETQDESALQRYGVAKIVADPEKYGVPEEYAEGFSNFMTDFFGFVLPQGEETARSLIPSVLQFAKDSVNVLRSVAGEENFEAVSKFLPAFPLLSAIESIPQEFIDKHLSEAKEIGALAKATPELQKAIERSQQRITDIENRAREQGLDDYEIAQEIAKGFGQNILDDPYAFAMNTLAVEAVEEILPLVAGGLGKLAVAVPKKLIPKAADAFGKDFSDALVKKIAAVDPTDAAVFAEFAVDIQEAIGLEYQGAYEEAYSLKINQFVSQKMRIAEANNQELTYDDAVASLSPEQIAEAEEHATFTGVMTGLTSGVLAAGMQKFGGGAERMKKLFGDKGLIGKSVDSIMEGITSRAEIVVKEGISEAFEEGVVSLVSSAINLGEGLIDDVTAISNSVIATLTGGVVGNGLTSGVIGVRDIASAKGKLESIAGDIGKAGADIVTDVVAKVNTGVKNVIEGAKAGVINDAQARETLAEFGITSGEGDAGRIFNNLMDKGFDAEYTTHYEVENAFDAAISDLDGVFKTSDKDINQYVGNNPDADLDTKVSEYVDSRFVDTQEVIDAAAAQGVTLTEEEAQQYVKQTSVDDDLVLDKIGDAFDDQVLTPEETRQLLIEAGYPEAEITGETIARVLGESANEEQGIEATKSFLNGYFTTLLRQSIDNPNSTPEQRKSLLDKIIANDPDSTAASDFNLNDDGTIQTDESGDTTNIGDTTTADTGTDATDDGSIDAGTTDDGMGDKDDTKQDPPSKDPVVDPVTGGDTTDTTESTTTTEGTTTNVTNISNTYNVSETYVTNITETVDTADVATAVTEEIANQLNGGTDLQTALTNVIGAAVDAGVANLESVVGTPAIGDEPATGLFADLADLGVSNAALIDVIGNPASDTTEATGLFQELEDLGVDVSGLETDLSNLTALVGTAGTEDEAATGIFAEIESLVEKGEALDTAIATVATNLGTTKDDLLEALGTTEDNLKEAIGDVSDRVGTAATEDEAATGLFAEVGETKTAIDELAEELGTTKDDLLKALGQTEETLSGNIEDIANILGKPASEVTDVDIDFVADLIAQQEALADPSTFKLTEEQLGYDVTGDGIVDATDLNLLSDVLAGTATLDPLADNRFAATGVFATQAELAQELEQQKQAELEFQKQQQLQQEQARQQAEQRAKESSQRDFLSMLLASEEGRVDVKASPLADLGRAYDFGSIFGDPQQANIFASPYGTPTTRAPAQQGPLRGGFRKGGTVERNEELLRLIREG